MKSRISLFQLIPAIFIFFFLFTVACTKEKSDGAQEEEEVSSVSSESDAEAEIIFNGIFDDVMGVNDDVGMSGTGVFGRTANGELNTVAARVTGCQTVTITHPNSTPFPVRIVIDFGSACVGTDGHTRRGKIICEYSNRLIFPGAIGSTHFENFYFDSIKVEGTHKITNTSAPITTQPPSRQFKVEIIDAKLLKPNGNYTEWNSTKTIKQIEGLVTLDRPVDDIFEIRGSARGRAKRDNLLVTWNSNVVENEPLIKRFTCRWISKGTIRTERSNTTTNNQWVALLNFGTGSCDNRAVITVNGHSHEITLR